MEWKRVLLWVVIGGAAAFVLIQTIPDETIPTRRW
jgi:hypothetical protein